ncbi:cell division protein FtsB [Teredinibacter purpureus]|uniref:cell division protein FtsB n=1 Tax=Teredinibacter purpureus TaxID=2731756 RepID=UPI0005F88717|nr:cell division protein FtsB [Teredinibacter purpureus]
MKGLISVLIVLFVMLQYRLWVGEGSIANVVRLQKEITKQRAENDRLSERNRLLAAEVKALKNGTDAIEGRARSEMGMIKEGETFFMIVEKDKLPQ